MAKKKPQRKPKQTSKPRSIPDNIWFRAGEGSRYSDEDAVKLGPALAALVRERQGELAAADIVEEAKDPRSVFHDYVFEEDDKTAAYRRREDIARSIIRSVYVCWTSNTTGAPVEESTRLLQWVVIPADDAEEEEEEESEETVRPGRRKRKDRRTRRLVTIDAIADNKAYERQMIENAKQDLKRWAARYRWFTTNLPTFKRKFRKAFEAIRKL